MIDKDLVMALSYGLVTTSIVQSTTALRLLRLAARVYQQRTSDGGNDAYA